MRRFSLLWIGGLAIVVSALAFAGPEGKSDEQERRINESDVPPPALAALRKLAAEHHITEYAEEVEHGCTYYEGSWRTPNGHVDALVTTAGDLVEIEAAIAEKDVPKLIVERIRAEAGKDAELRFEKKTVILYEAKFKKGARRHEVLLSADGRRHGHEEEDGDEDD